MYKHFDELGFKPGDIVKCTKSDLPGLYRVGKTYKLEKHENSNRTITCGGFTGYSAKWEKVETKMEFEDQWHLNDGKVTIPDDADKLEKDGSVVAFRKRKPPEFKFGDMVKTKSGNICIVVGKDQEGLYRVIGENMVHSVAIFTDSLTKI